LQKSENILTFDDKGNMTTLATSKSGELIRTQPDTAVAEEAAALLGAQVVVASKGTFLAVLQKTIAENRRVANAQPVITPYAVGFFPAFAALVLCACGTLLFVYRR
jgi:hypothetical protein